MNLLYSIAAACAAVCTPAWCSAQPAHEVLAPRSSTPVDRAVSRRSDDGRAVSARSFEQLLVFVGPGARILLREGTGEEVSARIVDLTATELQVVVDGQRRTLQTSDVVRIRQRRGDSLGNGAWWGFGVGAGFALMAAGVHGSGFLNSVEWVAALAAMYGGMGAGVGVGVDALIRGRTVIYDHPQPTAGAGMHLVPVIGKRRVGGAVSLRF